MNPEIEQLCSFERYRLAVAESMPAGPMKSVTLDAIRSRLRSLGAPLTDTPNEGQGLRWFIDAARP
jgi:hypothetical protein